ncbi:MAG: hypothetical protein LBM66_02415 [Bifidobacteriaceae bacterium]|jgi:hypothetical protein|nr:hypothetical protein [Bifidobacteriaceae bacterium]
MRNQPPRLTWPIGARVTVRRRLREADGRPTGKYSDAVGFLTENQPDRVTVRTRHGEVSVPASDIAIAKLIAPPQDPPQDPPTAG